MGFSWTDMIRHMGAPALAVAIVLAVFGLASLTVFFERFITARRSRAASKSVRRQDRRRSAAGTAEGRRSTRREQMAKESHLARVVKLGDRGVRACARDQRCLRS